jgi:hypothetical protein
MAKHTEQAARMNRAEEKAKDTVERSNIVNERAAKAHEALAEREREKQAVQSEFDDLLIVLGDLEEKYSRYKERLKELGETVSDGEEGEDDDNDTDNQDDID